MKTSPYTLIRSCYLPLLLISGILFNSCKKENRCIPPRINEDPPPASNYVQNGNFAISEQHSMVPDNWQAHFEHDVMEFVNFMNGTVAWSRNSGGSYYFSQQVTLNPNKYYKVSIDFYYDIHNHYKGGLYVMDTSFSRILGKSERYAAAGTERLEFVISTNEDTVVNLVFGFLNGMNASALFTNPIITEYDYLPRIQNSDFSNFLVKELKLAFTETRFDKSIQAVSDYVNEILLSEYQNRSVDLDVIYESTIADSYPYFMSYLNDLSNINVAYCQKSALSLTEILTNEFNIPVRQIHMQKDGIGFHQFIEYWNPFANKWIIADPYFGMVYSKNDTLLNVSEISMDEFPGVFKRFGEYRFSASDEEAVEFWENTENLQITVDPYLSYPFGNAVIYFSRNRTRKS
jgi:hypothetical protein